MIKFKKNKIGFSMPELIIVMLIIGELTSIVISKINSSDTGAIKASMKSDLRNTIRGLNSCYSQTFDYNICVSKSNPVEFNTVESDRKLGDSIYIGITTEGNSIKITTSSTDKKYFGVSCLNNNIKGYIFFNNSNVLAISDFVNGVSHPTLSP